MNARKRKIKKGKRKPKLNIPTPDLDYGLSQEQVEAQIKAGNYNRASKQNFKSNREIIRDNLFTYFNFVLFAIFVVLLIFKSYVNLLFIVVALINTTIGIVQEIRSRKQLREIHFLNQSESTVLRSGKIQKIKNEEIVLNDILVLKAGDQLSVDARLLSGELKMNESQVTGESRNIKKTVDEELFSGTFVVTGSGKAIVEKVSSDTHVAKLESEAKAAKEVKSTGMMRSLDKLIKVIGLLIIPVAGILFWNQYVRIGAPLKVSVESTAASIIGLIPSGLYLLTSIALTAATLRLAKKSVLVQDMNSIESLARVDVLCLDKTGTITDPEMKLRSVLDENGEPVGDEVESILITLVNNMGEDSNTMISLQQYYKEFTSFKSEQNKDNLDVAHNKKTNNQAFKVKRILPFSSANKFSAVEVDQDDTQNERKSLAYVIGAPEILIKDKDNKFLRLTDELSNKGERILALAKYEFEENTSEDIFAENEAKLEGELEVLALVCLNNPVRAEAVETFSYFANEGVAIKVISGDAVETVRAVAKEAKIQNADKAIDARSLDTVEKLRKAATNYTIFARVTPEQKRVLIEALQDEGKTVAMVGDGVNDVLALKKSDMGIAMASGVDAASQIADVVLADSDFSKMPEVLGESRQVINNIERTASLFLNKNMGILLISIFCIILGLLYPWQPIQISVVSGVMVGFPGFFLTMEKDTRKVSGKFLANVLFRAIPTAVLGLITSISAIELSKLFALPTNEISTIAFYVYAFSTYLMLYKACQPLTRRKKILLICMGIMTIMSGTIFSKIFMLRILSIKSLLLVIVIIALSIMLYIPLEKFSMKIFNKYIDENDR